MDEYNNIKREFLKTENKLIFVIFFIMSWIYKKNNNAIERHGITKIIRQKTRVFLLKTSLYKKSRIILKLTVEKF